MFNRERYAKIIEDHSPASGLTPECSEEIARLFLLALNRKKYYRVLGYECSNDLSKLGHYIYTRYHGHPEKLPGRWCLPTVLNEVADKIDMDWKDVSTFLALLAWRILELDRDPNGFLEEMSRRNSIISLGQNLEKVVQTDAVSIAA